MVEDGGEREEEREGAYRLRGFCRKLGFLQVREGLRRAEL